MIPYTKQIRRSISSRMAPSLVWPARRVVRFVDQVCGLPLAHRRPGAIAMFHVGRCGSTVLGDLLDQHPRILWAQEIYFQRWAERGLKIREFDNRRFLRHRMWAAGRQYYGFETKFLDHLDLAIIRTDLKGCVDDFVDSGVTHFIILKRENHLRTLVSWLVGRRRKMHHIEAGQKATQTKVRLAVSDFSFGVVPTPRSLPAWFKHIDQAYENLTSLLEGRTVLPVCYERDIQNDPTAAFRRCCEFLDLQPCNVRVNFSRTNPFALTDMLENYDEVESVLQGTPYEWMLSD